MTELIAYLHQILVLCRKELLALFKDPSSRVVLVAPVLVQSMLFGYAATYDLNHIYYAVLDQSHSEASAKLLNRLDGSGVFERNVTLTSPQQIPQAVDRLDAMLVLSIPADFADKLQSGEPAPVQVIVDGRNSATASSALLHMNRVITSFNQQQQLSNAAIQITRRAWYNPNVESRWSMMTAMVATLSIIQTLMLAALSVAREREQGTFDQLLVTPLAPMQILAGKAIPAIMVGLVQSTLVLLISLFWFGIPFRGELWLMYLALLAFTGAGVGIGLTISAISLTMQQAMLYTFLIILPLMLLSGLITPIDNMPEILQLSTWANPLRFGIELIRRIYMEGAVFADIAHDFIPLLIMAAFTLPLAAWMFRHRLG
ncbi:ABC transporter permease [Oceanobacter mangrovi]|uniref:ABC transporter permease n=1 Tax=Oceanobacter mangrovi TaxID=2862510 RepID=UPI001C8D31C9|nr:ABC transporter permease [Oceanobacter mangrovi]